MLIGLDWLTLHGALVHGALVDCPGRRLCFGNRYEYAEQDDARDVIRGTQLVIRGTQLVMLAMSLQTTLLQTSCMDEFTGVAPWKPAAAERISAAVDTAYAGGANWQLAVDPPAVVARTTRDDWAIEDVSTPLHTQMPLACFIQPMAGVALAPANLLEDDAPLVREAVGTVEEQAALTALVMENRDIFGPAGRLQTHGGSGAPHHHIPRGRARKTMWLSALRRACWI